MRLKLQSYFILFFLFFFLFWPSILLNLIPKNPSTSTILNPKRSYHQLPPLPPTEPLESLPPLKIENHQGQFTIISCLANTTKFNPGASNGCTQLQHGLGLIKQVGSQWCVTTSDLNEMNWTLTLLEPNGSQVLRFIPISYLPPSGSISNSF